MRKIPGIPESERRCVEQKLRCSVQYIPGAGHHSSLLITSSRAVELVSVHISGGMRNDPTSIAVMAESEGVHDP